MNEDRIPIWSVTSRTALAYFILFTGQIVIGVWLAVDTGWNSTDSVPINLLKIWKQIGSLVLASVAFSTIVVEIGAWVMVLTRNIRERLREEGRKEAQAKWEEDRRRLEERIAALEGNKNPPDKASSS
jgi:hypothetical protein